MSSGKAQARPKRTARKQLQKPKGAIADTAKHLRVARDDLSEACSFLYVGIQGLRSDSKANDRRDVVAVLSAAYRKLLLYVSRNVRVAPEGVGQEGGK